MIVSCLASPGPKATAWGTNEPNFEGSVPSSTPDDLDDDPSRQLRVLPDPGESWHNWRLYFKIPARCLPEFKSRTRGFRTYLAGRRARR